MRGGGPWEESSVSARRRVRGCAEVLPRKRRINPVPRISPASLLQSSECWHRLAVYRWSCL